MPLDPKYSNLPYIAADQPDIYESGDLPESDQHAINQAAGDSSTDPDVQQFSIDHAAAMEKFRGKTLTSESADFTDAVRAGRRAGYSLRRRDLEIAADGEEETPLQKFQRLQAELHSLAAVVEEAKKGAQTDEQTATPDQLAALVRGLQQEIAGLHLDSVLGAGSGDSLQLFDPESCLQKRLEAEIEKLAAASSSAAAAAPAAAPAAGGGDASVGAYGVYEVYARPPAAGGGGGGSDLEARLSRLEAAIGRPHLKAPALSGDLAGRSLWEAAHRLTGRLALLDPNCLDQLDSRLAALNHRLQQVTSDKREVLADADTQARVAELYELVKKWDASADCVQSVVARLQSLQQLHEQAMQFSGALSLVDQSQRAASSQLAAAQSLLSGLQERVAQDLRTVEANTNSLQQRFKAIGK